MPDGLRELPRAGPMFAAAKRRRGSGGGIRRSEAVPLLFPFVPGGAGAGSGPSREQAIGFFARPLRSSIPASMAEPL